MQNRLPTMALKPREDVTRSLKQGYQWPHKKDSCNVLNTVSKPLQNTLPWDYTDKYIIDLLTIQLILSMPIFYSPVPPICECFNVKKSMLSIHNTIWTISISGTVIDKLIRNASVVCVMLTRSFVSFPVGTYWLFYTLYGIPLLI